MNRQCGRKGFNINQRPFKNWREFAKTTNFAIDLLKDLKYNLYTLLELHLG